MTLSKSTTIADPFIVERVIAQFNALHPVSAAFKDDMYKHAFLQQLKKNAFLVKEGMICDSVYFVVKGIIRGFSTKRNRELTTWISVEGDFVTSISGMYGKVSKESMQAIDNCTLVGVPVDVLQQWYERFPEMNIIMRKILEAYYQEAQERSYIIRIGSAREKYDYFIENRPGQIDIIPIPCIASFLGMTTETLMRIRETRKKTGNDQDTRILVNFIEQSITAEQLFKIKSLSITQLAGSMSMPAHLLSYVLNEHYKKRFTDFINGYRVNYVKQQLRQGREWKQNKVEALGLEAGFASRSTFFAAFKKLEGVTPAAYAEHLHAN
ncbi:helix-turn-helix domain-containing protein [Filimonas effusa]|uniref:Helix-turn-helix domain-containing protein n=1 Tax=Filimonas effusa TaxID=2508721 RepID=A0A4Q1D537_9BACT|nr:helix-turn-helix domain-containing protein [Filimonas effusa]RXK82943.1 helix-turn-helix domain-containing protein [Filimonas effusa]